MKNVSKASGISMNVLHTNVDYAAIIREFEMYGRGRSLKQFCDDSSYV